MRLYINDDINLRGNVLNYVYDFNCIWIQSYARTYNFPVKTDWLRIEL